MNKKFNISPPKTEKDVRDWNYRSIYHQCTNEIINEIYDSEEFFENVTIDPDFKNFYLEYENCFDWYIVTKGHKQNLKHKVFIYFINLPKVYKTIKEMEKLIEKKYIGILKENIKHVKEYGDDLDEIKNVKF